ncbi:arylesterase [Sphingomicrobium sp. XHP0239]|uniref:arylesterase n=1 Tax=Sphingomicrobium maritimum TaxID=3133972 RepID=UPI0031CC9C2C
MLRLLALLLMLLALPSTGGAQPSTDRAEPVTILAFGDSLTAGYGLDEGLGFAPQLEDALRREGRTVRVIDAGVSGETSAQGLDRVEWTLDNLDRTPDMVILELGGNDMLRAVDPAEVERNLAALIERFQQDDIRVLLAAIPAAQNYDRAYIERFDGVYTSLGERYGVTVHPFLPQELASEPGMLLPDGVHPTYRGIKRIVTAMLPVATSELDAL